MGLKLMRALRKGQAAVFNLTEDIRGEARVVERAFGIGVSALAEASEVFGEKLTSSLLAACGRATTRTPLSGLIVATES